MAQNIYKGSGRTPAAYHLGFQPYSSRFKGLSRNHGLNDPQGGCLAAVDPQGCIETTSFLDGSPL